MGSIGTVATVSASLLHSNLLAYTTGTHFRIGHGLSQAYDFRGLQLAIPGTDHENSPGVHGHHPSHSWPDLKQWSHSGLSFLVRTMATWSEGRTIFSSSAMVRSYSGNFEILLCYPIIQGDRTYVSIHASNWWTWWSSKRTGGSIWGSAAQPSEVDRILRTISTAICE